MKPKNAQELYDNIALKYSANRSKAANDVTELPKVIELAGKVGNKFILDLGCGLGKHSAAFLEQGAEVTGIDASAEMIRIAQKTCRNKGKFFVADFETVTFLPQSFDLIIASYSVMYSKKIEDLFRKCHFWLKDGGRFIFSIYHPIQYFLKVKNFDFSRAKKVWFRLKSYDVEIFNYYYPLENYFDWINQSQFKLLKVCETVVPRTIRNWPEEKYRIPTAMVFEVGKND